MIMLFVLTYTVQVIRDAGGPNVLLEILRVVNDVVWESLA